MDEHPSEHRDRRRNERALSAVRHLDRDAEPEAPHADRLDALGADLRDPVAAARGHEERIGAPGAGDHLGVRDHRVTELRFRRGGGRGEARVRAGQARERERVARRSAGPHERQRLVRLQRAPREHHGVRVPGECHDAPLAVDDRDPAVMHALGDAAARDLREGRGGGHGEMVGPREKEGKRR